jgi:hypothetical protein
VLDREDEGEAWDLDARPGRGGDRLLGRLGAGRPDDGHDRRLACPPGLGEANGDVATEPADAGDVQGGGGEAERRGEERAGGIPLRRAGDVWLNGCDGGRKAGDELLRGWARVRGGVGDADGRSAGPATPQVSVGEREELQGPAVGQLRRRGKRGGE